MNSCFVWDKGLRGYVEGRMCLQVNDPYYNEEFCWAVGEYYSSKGPEYTPDDEAFLVEHSYCVDDFSDEMKGDEIDRLWRELEDVPFDDTAGDMILAQDFYIWKKGTEREDIWHWFDKHHPRGIQYLLYE